MFCKGKLCVCELHAQYSGCSSYTILHTENYRFEHARIHCSVIIQERIELYENAKNWAASTIFSHHNSFFVEFGGATSEINT
jgi:hypothetical protein